MNQKAVEREVHQAFINLCQTVMNEYGLRIERANISWLDTGAVAGRNQAVVRDLELTMVSKPE